MNREKFEAWFKSDFHPDKTGPYLKETLFFAWQAACKASEQQLAAVVAENAGLKSAIDATVGWQQSTDSENVESVRMLADIQTPATDAFLAEVRAQGVDAAIEQLHKKFEGTGHIGVPVMVLESFAAQLRQGAEHE